MKWTAKPEKREDAWYPWFAWHPVRVEGQWVWLEWVERWKRFMGYYQELDYRFPKGEKQQ